jgi:hypothetical protein
VLYISIDFLSPHDFSVHLVANYPEKLQYPVALFFSAFYFFAEHYGTPYKGKPEVKFVEF